MHSTETDEKKAMSPDSYSQYCIRWLTRFTVCSRRIWSLIHVESIGFTSMTWPMRFGKSKQGGQTVKSSTVNLLTTCSEDHTFSPETDIFRSKSGHIDRSSERLALCTTTTIIIIIIIIRAPCHDWLVFFLHVMSSVTLNLESTTV